MSLVELFRRFAQPLNELAIPYMATGAVAAIVYGEPRLTLDLDLVLALDPGQAGSFAAAFPSAEFYVPPVDAIRDEARRARHGHFNLLHHDTGLRADIYLAGDDPLDAWGLAHRREERLAGELIWLAPAEYVIVRKLEYFHEGHSSKHIEDIRAILRVRPDLVDRVTVEEFVRRRGLDPEWAQVSGSRA